MASDSKTPEEHRITELLFAYRSGDRKALDALIPIVYGRLKKLAAANLRGAAYGKTLQPTALLHEAFLKIINGSSVSWENRAHFFAVAARVMRQIIIDHAKAKRAKKRGAGVIQIEFDEKFHAGSTADPDVLELDDAIKKLMKVSKRQAQIVELRFFGGLTVEETAEVLKTSPATIKREWQAAKLFLYREISNEKKAA